jgi:hypothetical protein
MKSILLVAYLAACGTNGSDTVACGSGWSQLGIEPASVPTECAPECKDPPANLHDSTAPECRVHDPYTSSSYGLTLPYFTTSDGRMGACVGGDTAADGPLLFEECYAPYP